MPLGRQIYTGRERARHTRPTLASDRAALTPRHTRRPVASRDGRKGGEGGGGGGMSAVGGEGCVMIEQEGWAIAEEVGVGTKLGGEKMRVGEGRGRYNG